MTVWKRLPLGPIAPIDIEDNFEFVIIYVEKDNEIGQFVFPKPVLVAKGIVSRRLEEGKRGFRVYSPWEEAKNKQALKTQEWQLKYFLSLKKNKLNVDKAISLLNLNDN